MEYWDILDESRLNTGRTIRRQGPEGLGEGEYHLVVEVAVTNSKKELLLTFRHPDKPYGNSWEITGGSAVAGEESLSAVARELSEETGIVAAKNAFSLVKTLKGISAFHDFYHLVADVPIEDVRLQEGETIDARWVNKAELLSLVEENKLCEPLVERYLDDLIKLIEE